MILLVTYAFICNFSTPCMYIEFFATKIVYLISALKK